MITALYILLVVLIVGLLLLTAITPRSSRHSVFELKRRRGLGQDTTLDELRTDYHTYVTSLLRIVQTLLIIPIVPVAIALFGPVLGAITSVLIAVTYGSVSRIRPLRRFAQRLYDEQEATLLTFVKRYKHIFKWLRFGNDTTEVHGLDSKAELEHLIEHSGHILSEDEKRLVTGSLQFEDKLVADVMTPKKDIFTITKHEILGPLVLDDLHKSGHESFPVVNGGGTDDIVGILRLRDVQTLDTTRKHTAKVETAMDPDVRFVGSDESLSRALNILLDSQHHMLIVIKDQSTVGIITLSDIIKTLFGRSR